MKRLLWLPAALLLLSACTSTTPGTPAVAPAPPLIAQAVGDVVAYDMVASSSSDLLSYDNPWTGAFGSAGDGFQKYRRGVSPTIPFALLDDSASVFPPDSLGIVGEGDGDEFFGVVDTINGDNSGPVSATWTFDVSGASQLALSVDVAAMGDFESSDAFAWYYAVDGGPEQLALAAVVDEAATQTYTLDGGASFTLSDPMTLQGTALDDDFQTFRVALDGTGATLTVRFEATANGGSEAFAFRDLVVTEGLPPGGPGGGGGGPGPALTPIHDVQGSGSETPIGGDTVTIEGVVVGDFLSGGRGEHGSLRGFYVQEEDADADADPATSEGVFVFEAGFAGDVDAGDLVRVTGTVGEFGGQTQITAATVEVLASGVALPSAASLTLPLSGGLEPFEGMRVAFPQDLTISEYFNFDRFGEIRLAVPLAGEDRLHQPTAVHEPGSPAALDRASENELRTIVLDDGRTSQNPDPARHPDGTPFDLANRFRGGDLLSGVTGVLGEAFGDYRVQPTAGATHIVANPRPAAPDPVGGSLRVASMNVLNYFVTLDDSGPICGPTGGLGCRGADDANELARQRAKLVAALAALDADVIGVNEVENDDGAALADLAAGLNDLLGAGSYAALDTGAIGTDAIKVGLLYRPDVVRPVGPFAILDGGVDARFRDDKNRPVLAQTFRELATGARVTVAVNHLKSKGSSCDDIGDPTDPDGQGNCNGTRTAAAAALVDWLATDPTGAGDAFALITGDLNAYDEEDPIRAVLAGADDAPGTADDWVDLIDLFGGELAYSFLFDAQLGYLDHALANAALAPHVTGATEWHINADEPDLLDYDTSFKKDAQDAIYAPDPYRSSDHDPVLVGLGLPVDPAGLVAVLREDVAALAADGALSAGNANALDAKLRAAEAALERGNATAAHGQLGAFLNEVDALVRSGRLGAGDAAPLRERAGTAQGALR